MSGVTIRPHHRPGLTRQFVSLSAGYWSCAHKWTVRSAVVLLVLLTIAQVGLAIWVNYWNRELFDALEARSLSELLRQVVTFAFIFAITMAVTALHLHVKRWIQLDWRRWLTSIMLDHWIMQVHRYRLQYSNGGHDNPDGRIAEDVRIATDSAVGLAHSLLYSLLILGSFIDILLSVSGTALLPGTTVAVPGYLVVMAFLYAGVGSALGWMLGRSLIRTTDRLQSVEADLRFGLAHAREHSESIALLHGERHERHSANALFANVGRGWNRQTLSYLGIVSFSTGYGTLLPVFPILISAPQYIAGIMTLGVLMQAAQAFQRLTSALSWPIDNLGELARCRASAERVAALYGDMMQLDDGEHGLEHSDRISVRHSDHQELVIRDLCLATPAGQLLLENFNLQVRRGERILISGDPAVCIGVFKAVAGLWPWGSGAIELPAGQEIAFVSQHPYLPEGCLRDLLCYPGKPGDFSGASIHRALECAGIAWLAARLDESADWEHVLPLRAQQRLGMARLLLHRPAWIFIENATDAFTPKAEILMMEMLHHELPNSTLMNINLHGATTPFHDRALILDRLQETRFVPGAGPESAKARG